MPRIRKQSDQRRKPAPARQRRSGRLRFEQLEARMMLDGSGFSGSGLLLSNEAFLTLSFAADGVSVAGQSNGLAAKFDAIAPRAVWQEAILQAFQTWASYTNADVGVIADGGQAFGSPGPTRGDTRFGDVRIAAIAMDPSIGGEATPLDQLVGGTWQADVIFNTNFTYQSLADIYAIALHEAGHVFGLDHSTDVSSPMHAGTIPTATTPTATDIANLQALYGVRLPDFNELEGGGPQGNNDTIATATALSVIDSPGIVPGSIPLLVYGDITSTGDVDYFKTELPDGYGGPIQIEVRSAGISLLAPRLEVYNKQLQLIHSIESSSRQGDTLAYEISGPWLDDKYYFAVRGATADLFGVGGYAAKVTFSGIPQVDLSVLSQYRDRDLRKLTHDEINKLIAPSEDDFLNEDNHSDDDLLNAVTLQSESDFVDPSRFETIGSISNGTDSDFYRVLSPQNIAAQTNVLTVSVHSLTAGQLVPTIRAFDHNLNALPVAILANGGGELVVQVSGIESNRNYYVEVAAANPAGPFHVGNYQLTASFRDVPASFTTFAEGTLSYGATANEQLYVGQPQLFHFLLQAGATTSTAPAALIASIYDANNQLVFRLGVPAGATQSQGAVLLAPGAYTVRFSTLTFQGSLVEPISYALSGLAISDPFVTDPTDPTTHPFANPFPHIPGAYMYPGPIFTNDPFLWIDFIGSLPNEPPPDLQTQIELLLGNWWTWYWGQTGVNGPPLGQADSFSMGANAVLDVSSLSGVLANDHEPEGEPMVAALVAGPRTGTLDFRADGSFRYTPAAGFNGAVQFVYQASDFQQLSNEVAVTIAVGLQGDYDHSGLVDQLDFNVWRGTFGSTTQLDADGNGNGVIDQGDYIVWRRNLGLSAGAALATAATAPASGEALGNDAASLKAASPLASAGGQGVTTASSATVTLAWAPANSITSTAQGMAAALVRNGATELAPATVDRLLELLAGVSAPSDKRATDFALAAAHSARDASSSSVASNGVNSNAVSLEIRDLALATFWPPL